VIGGAAFAVGQFLCANYFSVELTDIVASLLATATIVTFLRVWSPAEPLVGDGSGRFTQPAVAGGSAHSPAMEREISRRDDSQRDSRADVIRAYAPYAVVIAVFSIAQIPAVKDALLESPWTKTFEWPGLDVVNPDGEALSSLTFNFNWLPATGTLMLIAGLITMGVLGVSPGTAVRTFAKTLDQLKWAILTVAAVLALAYVMNQSGQTVTLGLWAAGAGGAFAFLSALIGWLGVAVTGSDTSSNALFGALQVTAAKDAGISDTLLAAANSSGGVLGKMISPQNLAIGAAAVGMAGQEGDLFRKVLGWSLVLVLIMCALVYLQSTAVLDWMVV
jgi:lactate permease